VSGTVNSINERLTKRSDGTASLVINDMPSDDRCRLNRPWLIQEVGEVDALECTHYRGRRVNQDIKAVAG